jgi:hypothetical protein
MAGPRHEAFTRFLADETVSSPAHAAARKAAVAAY